MMMERLTREDWKNKNSLMYQKVEELNINEKVKKDLKDVLRKLARYEDLEEKGRILELPCSLGDRLYWVSDEYTDKVEPAFEIKEDTPIKAIAVKPDGFYTSTDGRTYDKIGSQFALLTYEDAEKKLKEMEEELQCSQPGSGL